MPQHTFCNRKEQLAALVLREAASMPFLGQLMSVVPMPNRPRSVGDYVDDSPFTRLRRLDNEIARSTTRIFAETKRREELYLMRSRLVRDIEGGA